MLFTKDYYKFGLNDYKMLKGTPVDKIVRIANRLKSTADEDMRHLHVMTDTRKLRPFSARIGHCSTTATVFPDELDDEGKPRRVQVLVDTGAKVTIIAARHVPENANTIDTLSRRVSGFGGGHARMDTRVRLPIKLHGANEENGIDIFTTAYISDDSASNTDVILGTDVMKALAPTIDLKKMVMRVQDESGRSFETPITFFKDYDKVQEPSPQVENAPPTETASLAEKI